MIKCARFIPQISSHIPEKGYVMKDIWDEYNALIIGVIVALCAIGLLVVGFSFLAAVLLAIVVFIIIYFGSMGVFAGSFVVAVLLKTMSGSLKQLTAIWFTGTAHDHFYTFVNDTGYITMIFVVFLLVYTLRFVTGSIRIFHFHNSVTFKNE